MGGLARRAGFINQQRLADKDVFVIAGPYEFVPLEGGEAPDNSLAQRLAQAYALLGYSAGYLAPEEADLLKKSEANLPKQWRTGGPEPTTELLTRNGSTVGVVYFPVLASRDAEPTALQIEAVLQKAASLRKDANVVVGVSPWGYKGEETLTKAASVGALDVILGAGPGAGLKGRMIGDKTLWVRAFSKGKAVNTVTFPEVPAKGTKSKLVENQNIIFDIVALKEDIQPEPKVDALFEGLR